MPLPSHSIYVHCAGTYVRTCSRGRGGTSVCIICMCTLNANCTHWYTWNCIGVVWYGMWVQLGAYTCAVFDACSLHCTSKIYHHHQYRFSSVHVQSDPLMSMSVNSPQLGPSSRVNVLITVKSHMPHATHS